MRNIAHDCQWLGKDVVYMLTIPSPCPPPPPPPPKIDSLYIRVFDNLYSNLFTYSLHNTNKRDLYIISSVDILLNKELQNYPSEEVRIKLFLFFIMSM